MYTTVEYGLARPDIYKEVTGEYPDQLLTLSLNMETVESVHEVQCQVTAGGTA